MKKLNSRIGMGIAIAIAILLAVIITFSGCVEDGTQSVAPAVTKQVGHLSVTSAPSEAEVYLDDNHVGTTPLTLSNVSVGSHSVKLSKGGYEDWTTEVDVKAEGIHSVSATLSEIDFTKPYEIAISTSSTGDYHPLSGDSIKVVCASGGADLTVNFNGKKIEDIM